MFAELECDALQPELQSGEVCNTLSHEGLANVNTEKNVISSLSYTFLSSTLGLNGLLLPHINGNEASGQ